jgi:hypothetical protein
LQTVLAEKLTTAIQLGAANSRIRDFADVWILTGIHDLDAASMRSALRVTASHRQIVLRPLGEALGDLALVRASTYTAYKRRLGQDGAALPGEFITLLDGVTAFTDTLLLNDRHRTTLAGTKLNLDPLTHDRCRAGGDRWVGSAPDRDCKTASDTLRARPAATPRSTGAAG